MEKQGTIGVGPTGPTGGKYPASPTAHRQAGVEEKDDDEDSRVDTSFGAAAATAGHTTDAVAAAATGSGREWGRDYDYEAERHAHTLTHHRSSPSGGGRQTKRKARRSGDDGGGDERRRAKRGPVTFSAKVAASQSNSTTNGGDDESDPSLSQSERKLRRERRRRNDLHKSFRRLIQSLAKYHPEVSRRPATDDDVTTASERRGAHETISERLARAVESGAGATAVLEAASFDMTKLNRVDIIECAVEALEKLLVEKEALDTRLAGLTDRLKEREQENTTLQLRLQQATQATLSNSHHGSNRSVSMAETIASGLNGTRPHHAPLHQMSMQEAAAMAHQALISPRSHQGSSGTGSITNTIASGPIMSASPHTSLQMGTRGAATMPHQAIGPQNQAINGAGMMANAFVPGPTNQQGQMTNNASMLNFPASGGAAHQIPQQHLLLGAAGSLTVPLAVPVPVPAPSPLYLVPSPPLGIVAARGQFVLNPPSPAVGTFMVSNPTTVTVPVINNPTGFQFSMGNDNPANASTTSTHMNGNAAGALLASLLAQHNNSSAATPRGGPAPFM